MVERILTTYDTITVVGASANPGFPGPALPDPERRDGHGRMHS